MFFTYAASEGFICVLIVKGRQYFTGVSITSYSYLEMLVLFMRYKPWYQFRKTSSKATTTKTTIREPSKLISTNNEEKIKI